MTLVGRLRELRYAGPQRVHDRLYDACRTDRERDAAQLDLWNAEWNRIARTVPYYASAVRSGELPGRFSSWDEFVALVPETTRTLVQRDRDRRASTERRPEWTRMTGGTTAEPIQLPAWKSELRVAQQDVWRARGWYGVHPSSRLFLLWGHAHLLGRGWRGWLKARQRSIYDRIVGYHRYSAYDLSDASMRRAADELLRCRPDYVLGYSVALDRFARVNEDRRPALRSLGVRVVIGAAEGFPAEDSRERLGDLFACPVAMEYGSVETMLMAHTRPEGGYAVLWRSFVVEAIPLAPDSRRARVRVTSLYPRCFPLVRYDLGDEIELDGSRAATAGVSTGSLHGFVRVLGRCNDIVALPDGSTVHSEAITHAVRECPQVQGYQFVQEATGGRVQYLANGPLPATAANAIRERLARIHPSLASVELRHVPALIQTPAGKTRMIVQGSRPAQRGA